MDVSTVVRACLRCWYVVLVVLLGTAYFAVGFYRDSQPEFTVSASVLVVPSQQLLLTRATTTPTSGISGNPFGSSNGPGILANALATALTNARVQSSVLPPGAGLSAVWDSEANTVVTLTTVSRSAAEADTAMTTVLGGLDSVLSDIQVRAGTPADQTYVVSPISEADFPRVTYPDRLRTVVATGLAGAVGAVVLAVLLDGLIAGRRRARHLSAPPAGGPDTPSRGLNGSPNGGGPHIGGALAGVGARDTGRQWSGDDTPVRMARPPVPPIDPPTGPGHQNP